MSKCEKCGCDNDNVVSDAEVEKWYDLLQNRWHIIMQLNQLWIQNNKIDF